MAAITQRIDNYLGGVSRQSDDKKKPGQVRECLNAYPDPTFGLTKRPGIKWITNLATTATDVALVNNSKWFYIHRDGDEKYVGCIKPASVAVTTTGTGSGTAGTYTNVAVASTSGTGTGMTVDVVIKEGIADSITINAVGTGYSNGDTITIAKANVGNTSADVVGTITLGDVDVWNAASGTACAVTYGTDAREYLTGNRDNYDVLTIQDTSIITNNRTVVDIKTAPSYNVRRQGTVALVGLAAGVTYTVKIKLDGITNPWTITYTAASDATYSDALTGLKGAIDTANSSGVITDGTNALVCTVLPTSLKLTCATSFTLSGTSGTFNDKANFFQDQIPNVSYLPTQTYNGHVLKIFQTVSSEDSFFAKFITDAGVTDAGGPGYWEETIDPAESTGLQAATMPHELVNSAKNTFIFRSVTWDDRKVGDAISNDHPSFKGKKIQRAFFHSNRLGFLSNDNVILSRSGEYYNFYNLSAQVQAESDPVDLRCTTTKPALLHSIVPTTQGLILFSKDQQFLMTAGGGALTPSTTQIKTISNYEVAPDVNPVDMGDNITFISRTPSYTSVLGMLTRGQEENPQTIDIGRVVNEWIPQTVDDLIGSPQNHFIALSDRNSDKVYFYRTYNDGNKISMQAWFRWELCGTVQALFVDSDEMFVVTKQGDQYTLGKANLSQSPDDAIIVDNQGNKVNPCMDLYAPAKSVAYQSVQTLTITAGGSGYTSAPTVGIAGSAIGTGAGTPGSGATATATISGGAVTALTLTNGGSGYENGALVSFTGGGGSGATATAAVLDGTKCYTEYSNVTTRTPVIVIAGTTATGQFIESGFTISPEVGSDGVGTYFIVPGKDLTSLVNDVYTGLKYDLDVELPKIYYYLDIREAKTDFTSLLTIARMKFAIGLSGVMGFKLKSIGTFQGTQKYTGTGAVNTYNWPSDTLKYVDKDQIKLKINGVVSTDFIVSGDTQITLTETGDRLSSYAEEYKTLTGNGTDHSFDLTFIPKNPDIIKVTVGGVLKTPGVDYRIVENYINFIDTTDEADPQDPNPPANNAAIVVYSADDIEIYLDEWYDLNPTAEANTYLANDIALSEQSVFSIPVHQKTDNFQLRVWNDSPFPVSLNSMMWEGNYTPRFYRRV